MLGASALNIVAGEGRWPHAYTTIIANKTVTDPADAASMAIAHINNPDNVAPLPIPTTVLSEHLLVDGTSAAERVAGALDQHYDQRRFANAGALDIAESRLTKWQRRKFDADIEQTRGTMNGLLSALGIRENIGIQELPGSSILVRRTP